MFVGLFRIFLSFLVVSGFAAGLSAAILEVTHTPSAGQYATVQAAFNAAVDGDVIELIDNSAPFIGRIDFFGKRLTLRGKEGLDPRPTIQGTSDAFYSLGVNGATIYFWSPTPGVLGGTCDGSTFQNLVFDGTRTSISIWAFFDLGPAVTTFDNCLFLGPRPSQGGGSTQNININFGGPSLFKDCEFIAYEEGNGFTSPAYNYHVNGLGGSSPRNVTFQNCKFSGGNQAFLAISGNPHTFNFDQCDIDQDWDSLPMFQIVEQGTVFSINGSVLREMPSVSPAPNKQYIQSAPATGNVGAISVTQCDVLASSTDPSIFLLVADQPSTVTVSNNIFYNVTGPWFLQGPAPIPSFTEDYNIYYNTINNLPLDYPLGVNSRELIDGDPLYVNLAGNDLRLLPESQAIFGPASYAGSQGPMPIPTSARNWTLY